MEMPSNGMKQIGPIFAWLNETTGELMPSELPLGFAINTMLGNNKVQLTFVTPAGTNHYFMPMDAAKEFAKQLYRVCGGLELP